MNGRVSKRIRRIANSLLKFFPKRKKHEIERELKAGYNQDGIQFLDHIERRYRLNKR